MFKVSFENFKGVKEGSIELHNFSIILGANNSGKSTILEAIYLLPDPLRFSTYGISTTYGSKRAFKVLTVAEVLNYLHKTYESEGYAFLLNDYKAEKAVISAQIDDETLALEFKILNDRIRIESTSSHGKTYIGSLHRWLNDYYRSSGIRKFKSLYFHPKLLELSWNYMMNRWIEIAGPGTTRDVAKVISKIIRDDYFDIVAEPFGAGKYTLYLYLADGRRIRLGDVGDGIKQIVTLLLLYKITKPEILLIDDVEAHMNPSMLTFLAMWLADIAKEKMYIIITTHSLEAADLITSTLDTVEPQIIISSLRNGKLLTKTITSEEYEELRNAGIDIRTSGGLLI